MLRAFVCFREIAECRDVIILLIVEASQLVADIYGAPPRRANTVYCLEARDRRRNDSVAPLAFGREQIEHVIFGCEPQALFNYRTRRIGAIGPFPQARHGPDGIDIVTIESKSRV